MFSTQALSLLGILCFVQIGLAQSDVDIELIPFANGLSLPVDISQAGDERLFVVEKAGLIRILRPDGSIDSRPFLDLSAKTATGGLNSERGLLGLAFHPDYENNGQLYVNYTDLAGDTQVKRYTVSADGDSVDVASEAHILEVVQPFGNHNGGCLRFGPDGKLYIGLGDGGGAEDPLDYGQDMASLLGKLLRLDVDNGLPYTIPADNPFASTGQDTLPEIWASGLRNPWRFSFDALSGDLYIGDVGQYSWEEIDHQEASSVGGENYGWRCYEGNHLGFGMDCPPMTTFDGPVWEYSHAAGHCSVTGGEVYRGQAYPALQGKYFYTDYCSGQFWSLEQDAAGQWVNYEVSSTEGFGWTCFGRDYLGEVYVVNQVQSTIYRLIQANCSASSPSITVNPDTSLTASTGQSYQWYLDGQLLPLATFQNYSPQTTGLYTVLVGYTPVCAEFAESVFIDLGDDSSDCLVYDNAPVDLNKSFDPVNGLQDRVQLKWYRDTPQIRYSDEDAAACDIRFWPKRTLDPISGQVNGTINDPDTVLLEDRKKYYADGVSPREIFKWPVKYRADGQNNAKRVDPNIRYQWQVRCACEHGAGQESPWSEVKIFNTPDFDPSTGILSGQKNLSVEPTGDEQSSLHAEQGLTLFPNPSEGASIVLQVDGLEEQAVLIELFDVKGVRQHQETAQAIVSPYTLTLGEKLSPGLYLLRVSAASQTYSQRFMVR